MGSHTLTPTPRRMTRGQRLAWGGVALALAVVFGGIGYATLHRPAAPMPTPVTLAAPPPAAVPTPEPTSRVGAGTYAVTDNPIAPGTWTAPGGPRCVWSVSNAKGSVLLEGKGEHEQRVDLRSGLTFRASGCGGWTEESVDSP